MSETKRDRLWIDNKELAALYDATFGQSKMDDNDPGSTAVGTTSVVVVNANAKRRYACLTNDSTGKMYLGLGTTAALGKGIPLDPGDSYEIVHDNLYTGTINAIADGANKSLAWQEGSVD